MKVIGQLARSLVIHLSGIVRDVDVSMSKFEVKLFSKENTKMGAALALKHRLYVSGWELGRELVNIKKGYATYWEISMGFLNDIPISIVIQSGSSVMAFCRKKYRRRGYGSATLNKIKNPGVVGGPGINGSRKFWTLNGINVY